MSETHDRMRRYETNNDAGDSNQENTDPEPAPVEAPAPDAPDQPGSDDSDNPAPIPTSTPQSPVQTEETEADKRGLSENSGADNATGSSGDNERVRRNV